MFNQVIFLHCGLGCLTSYRVLAQANWKQTDKVCTHSLSFEAAYLVEKGRYDAKRLSGVTNGHEKLPYLNAARIKAAKRQFSEQLYVQPGNAKARLMIIVFQLMI